MKIFGKAVAMVGAVTAVLIYAKGKKEEDVERSYSNIVYKEAEEEIARRKEFEAKQKEFK